MIGVVAILLAVIAPGPTYRVQTDSGAVITVSGEDYVAAVVTGEGGNLQQEETLKALAVAARTYAARLKGRHAKDGFDFCSTTHCQRFVAASVRGLKAARDTAGQMIWFRGEPAFAVYSQNCGGRTEAVSAVWPDVDAPYLASHADPYCFGSWTWSASMRDLRQALSAAGLRVPADLHAISIVSRTGSGRAKIISLNGELVAASSFRYAVSRRFGWNTIRSDLYELTMQGGRVFLHGSGQGHGVGLCQVGADRMAAAGKNYREILAFYYPGTTVGTTADGLTWKQLAGEGVVLHSVATLADSGVIRIAEQALRKWRGRFPWPAPERLDLYVYPTVAAFRNATGEPGWVAARTEGSAIRLQPASVLASHRALESTVEHEVVHALVECHARHDLPVWFREGLVGELIHPVNGIDSGAVSDEDLRQRHDQMAAHKAYEAAAIRVTELSGRYGETTVLSWVVSGIPAEVMNSINKSPAVKTK